MREVLTERKDGIISFTICVVGTFVVPPLHLYCLHLLLVTTHQGHVFSLIMRNVLSDI
jgi:hypothetical protein